MRTATKQPLKWGDISHSGYTIRKAIPETGVSYAIVKSPHDPRWLASITIGTGHKVVTTLASNIETEESAKRACQRQWEAR